jgi:serine/threonine-protein kinase
VILVGRLLSGRYRLMELLGQGAMAGIYRAQDVTLGREVAVKVIRPELGRDPGFVARFRAEAQAAAALNDPHVVAVYDYGEDEVGPYIVMELVRGEDLAIRLARGRLAPHQAATVALQVARGLAAAHRRGLVHRDVKPSNILLGSDGRVKIGDFGIARALAAAELTAPGTMVGSVHYLSPEEVRGEPVTPAADVYALGIVLYEMLTGRRPFEGESATAVALARLTVPVVPPRELVPSIPASLEAIVLTALARDPADRYPEAGAMAADLQRFLAAEPAGPAAGEEGETEPGEGAPFPGPSAARPGVPAAVRPPGVAPGAPMEEAEDQLAGAEEPAEPEEAEAPQGPGPWPWIAGLLGLGILALTALLVFLFLTRVVGGPPPSAAPQVVVPTFIGMQIDDARTLADARGLQVDLTFVPSGEQPPGTVIAQDPLPGVLVDAGSSVRLTVVSAAGLVSVPDLRGKPETTALNLLISAGLTVGTRSEAYDPVIPAGSLVSQNPPAGAQVARGSAVDYVVSLGPAPSPSPSPVASPSASAPPSPSPSPSPSPVASPSASAPPSPSPSPSPSPPSPLPSSTP